MRLDDERYEFIKGEIVNLYERYNVRCIPISGFELAHKMGLKPIPYSALTENQYNAAVKVSTDGFYMEDNTGNNFIYYNDNVSYERLNMTLLHEIGHCVLDHKGESDEEEAEACFFAKYAAAPPPLIHCLSDKSTESIEKTFSISYTAAVYAGNYYQKWLVYGDKKYTDYEIRLLNLFSVA
jgi:hypothetical protein